MVGKKKPRYKRKPTLQNRECPVSKLSLNEDQVVQHHFLSWSKDFSPTKEKIKAFLELLKTWYFVWLEKCAELRQHHYMNYKNYKNWRHATRLRWGLHKEKYIFVCRANIHLYTEKYIFSGQANILLTENYISSRQTNIWWCHTAVTSIQLSQVGAVHRKILHYPSYLILVWFIGLTIGS